MNASMFAVFSAIVSLTALGSPAAASWSGLHQFPCPRCVKAKKERASSGFNVPENAIIYFFAGEFAKKPRAWLIDLDTGSVFSRSSDTVGTDDGVQFSVDADTLAGLRKKAIQQWGKHPNAARDIHFVPGAVSDCFIVSKHRMVPFDPLDPHDPVAGTVEQIIERAGSRN